MINPFILFNMFMVIDVVMTTVNLLRLKKILGEQKAIDVEINPLTRSFLRKFGIIQGMILAFCVSATVINLFVLLVLSKNVFMYGFMAGIYTIVTVIHYSNSSKLKAQLKSMKKKARGKNAKMSNKKM